MSRTLDKKAGAMVSIHLKTHVGADGTVNLTVPTEFRETDLDVLVVLNPVEDSGQGSPSSTIDWPAGFFEETFGSLREEPLARPRRGKADN
jgi:hypothetical protein